MSCFNLTQGIAADCATSLGGIKKVYFMSNDVTYGLGTTVDADKVDSITGATAENTFVFNFRKNTGSMTSTVTTVEGGGSYISTEVALQFSKMEAQKRMAINGLLKSQVKAVVVDSNGIAWALGYDEPLEATAGGGATGQNKSDLNNYNITMTDESMDFPRVLTAAALAELEALE